MLEALSVFSTFARFEGINPVVKAPTLVCDDGGTVPVAGGACAIAARIARVAGQLLAAYAALEQEVARRPALFENNHCQATITAAVAWKFTQSLRAASVPAV